MSNLPHELYHGISKEKRMHQIKLREEYIKLGQALKAAGFAESGVDAKNEILDGKVKVNGAIEYQRGKKLHDGDIVDYKGEQIRIMK
jgi:ribosome-associated protein